MNATNFRANVMATRWGCLGAGKIASDFFTAIKENLPAEEHKVIIKWWRQVIWPVLCDSAVYRQVNETMIVAMVCCMTNMNLGSGKPVKSVFRD